MQQSKHPIKFFLKGINAAALVPFLFFGHLAFAQNLVPNGNFEQYEACPDNIGQIARASNWFSLNTGTPEYFNMECGYSQTKANSGVGYAGFIFHCEYEDAVEYIQVRLKNPLQPTKHCISLKVKAKKGPFYSDGLSILLKEGKVKLNEWRAYRAESNYTWDTTLVPSKGWMTLTGSFEASGGEDVLIIGNFNAPEKLNLTSDRTAKYASGWQTYLYIDDVVIMEGYDCMFTEKVNPIENGIPFKADSMVVYFDFDSHSLNQMATGDVTKFIESKAQGDLRVRIIGHTDDKGSEEYNISLSERRVSSVKNYIMKLGYPINNLTLVAKGESKPSNSNNSELGRAKNRRVVLVVEHGGN